MGCAGFLCTRSVLALLNVFYMVSYSKYLCWYVVTAVISNVVYRRSVIFNTVRATYSFVMTLWIIYIRTTC